MSRETVLCLKSFGAVFSYALVAVNFSDNPRASFTGLLPPGGLLSTLYCSLISQVFMSEVDAQISVAAFPGWKIATYLCRR